MALSLPSKSALGSDANAATLVYDQLTSVIAGHAQATTTYRFYEELDTWLGPWGAQGYPIAYGKFYNLAFSGNQKLMADAKARDWVWRTTILLQEALRDYVVQRVKDGTLARITEAELRQAAFESHPAAYDSGGLAMLALVAPELIPIVGTIPLREFCPASDNFDASVAQVLATVGRISPQLAGNSLAALALPAHNGMFARAARQDQLRMTDEMALGRELGALQVKIDRGQLDHVPTLDRLIAALNGRQFPDQGFAQGARLLVQAAEARRRQVVQKTNQILQQSPAVRSKAESAFPKFFR
jgi:hypothetical protein